MPRISAASRLTTAASPTRARRDRRCLSLTTPTPAGSGASASWAPTAWLGRAARRRDRSPTARWPSSSCTSTARLCTTEPRSPYSETFTSGEEPSAMPYDFQLAIDADRPHDLADWWAETLGWVVEPSDEAFIRRMIAEGYATDSDTMTHNGTLVWKDGAAIRHPDELAADGTRPRVLFQRVPEAKSVKNRLHLDVR